MRIDCNINHKESLLICRETFNYLTKVGLTIQTVLKENNLNTGANPTSWRWVGKGVSKDFI